MILEYDQIKQKNILKSTITANNPDNSEQLNISASGVISKTASGVTKTFNLPAESGTLARKEETLPNKTYAPAEFSGLGRKYLQKNIVSNKNVLTQAMLQDGSGNALTNYVFVVQYDYDLNGQTVNVPAETTLKFEGGSIKNGTLNFGKGVLVESEDVKIFDDVLFTGDCGGQYFHIDWFVANYAQTIADTEPDATAEIQAMFDCGIKKVWFTNNHHYRLTDTVVVDADIIIGGEMQKGGYDNGNVYIFSSMQKPLITIKASKTHYATTVENIYLYRIMSNAEVNSTTDYKKDIPTLYVDCTEGDIWWFYFTGVLDKNPFKTIYYPADGTTEKNEWGFGYRGIEIYAANGHYATGINLHGSIKGYYEAAYIHKDTSNSWITGVNIRYDSVAIYGGRIDSPNVTIDGEHQTTELLPSNTDGYFTISGDCKVVGGYIYDTSIYKSVSATDLRTAYYSIKASYIYGAKRWSNVYSDNYRNIKYTAQPGPLGNAVLAANFIPDVFYNMKYGNKNTGGLHDIVFKAFSTQSDYEDFVGGDTTKGVALTEETVDGFADLFFPDKVVTDQLSWFGRAAGRMSYMKNDMAVKVLYFSCETSSLYNATIIVNAVSDRIQSVEIDNGQGNVRTFNVSSYFRPIFVPTSGGANMVIKVVITYTQAYANHDIPYIGICGAGAGNLVGAWGGSVYGDLATNRLSSTDLSVDKITDVTNIDTPVVNNIYKRAILSKRGIIPIGDGGAQAQIAHLQYTMGSYSSMYLSFIESGRRWELYIHRSPSSATIARGVAQNYEGQAFYTYEKDIGGGLVDLVVTADRMSSCLLLDVWGNTKPTIIDDMETVDTTGYTQTKASMACIRQAWTSSIGNGLFFGDVYMAKGNGLFARWNGSKWIEFDGATSNVKRRGASTSRPSSSDIYEGFTYWDSDLGKMIAWNGSAWVNLDGTALS